MADDAAQKRALEFLLDRFVSQQVFTKQDLMKATGWSDSSVSTYLTKQFRRFIELDGGGYRVKSSFLPHRNWKRFKALVTQNKAEEPYAPAPSTGAVLLELLLPLTHETALRQTLDDFFFLDGIRLRIVSKLEVLKGVIAPLPGESNDSYLDRLSAWIADRFVGYSIYHVQGRFRLGSPRTRSDSAQLIAEGGEYLADETTAVTRFIAPSSTSADTQAIRFLFKEIFVSSLLDAITGEDEVWMTESLGPTQLYIWRRS